MPRFAEKYLVLQTQCLAYYWALVETKQLTIEHQVTIKLLKLQLMKKVLCAPLRHKFSHV